MHWKMDDIFTHRTILHGQRVSVVDAYFLPDRECVVVVGIFIVAVRYLQAVSSYVQTVCEHG